ncbi:MAG: hypothetical protein GY953_09190 [bacterium]|nr:hypothetical protein [bacterium]
MLATSLDYEHWYCREVDKGQAAADRGELIDHEEVGRILQQRYPAETSVRDPHPR